MEDLENFTTIDSVGDVDEADSKQEEATKEVVNVGLEQIRKVEAHYCELCKMYLPRADDSEMTMILQRHCKMKVHMSRYVRFKDLERRAEKLQKKETAEKEAKKKEDAEAKEAKDDKSDDIGSTSKEEEEATEDKIWEDVDKDLGDIIAEAESGAKSSDEDEDDSHMNGERYDR